MINYTKRESLPAVTSEHMSEEFPAQFQRSDLEELEKKFEISCNFHHKAT